MTRPPKCRCRAHIRRSAPVVLRRRGALRCRAGTGTLRSCGVVRGVGDRADCSPAAEMASRMSGRPARRATLDGWPPLVVAAGFVALLAGALWWWSIPPSERYYRCLEEGSRNGCARSEGSLGGPIVLLVLGGLLLVLGLGTSFSAWLKARDRGSELSPRRRPRPPRADDTARGQSR